MEVASYVATFMGGVVFGGLLMALMAAAGRDDR